MLADIPQNNEETEMHFLKSEVSRWEMLGIIWHAYQIPLLCKKRIIHVDIDLVDVSIPPFLSVKSFLLQGHLYLEWQYWHITWISTQTTSSGIHFHEFKFHVHTGIFSSVEDRFILRTLYTPWLFSENVCFWLCWINWLWWWLKVSFL